MHLTLITAFVASSKCNYELGKEIWCNSTDLYHGMLFIRPKTWDFAADNNSCPFSVDLNSSCADILNRFVVLDILFSGDGQMIVIGSLQHSFHVEDTVDGLLIWFIQEDLLLPLCATTPFQLCSVSRFLPQNLLLDTYWSGFGTGRSIPLPDISEIALFLSYVPLCSLQNNSYNKSRHCLAYPITNFHSPVALIPPIFAVPVTEAELPPFHFKSYDDDGHKMTQYVPSNFSLPPLTARCVFPPPNTILPGWQTGQCMGGQQRGMPCSLSPSMCGEGIPCAATWSECREFRDADPDVASVAGNLLRFNFSFTGTASPFRGGASGPLERAATAEVPCSDPSCLPLTATSQHAVYTFDYPWSTPSSPDVWPTSAGMPSWRAGSAAVLSVFTVFPNDCGAANLPPAFVRGLGSTDTFVETERSCVVGSACEIALYVRDFSEPTYSEGPLLQTQDTVRVDLAAGFGSRAQLQRVDGSRCVGAGYLECIATLAVPVAAQRIGSTHLLCLIASDVHPPGAAAKSCVSLPLCIKIRLDAVPLVSNVLVQLGMPLVAIIAEQPSVAASNLVVNVSWTALPSNWTYYNRISGYGIECSVDGGVFVQQHKLIGANESSVELSEIDIVRNGSHQYNFRILAFCATDFYTLKYLSVLSPSIKIYYPYSAYLPTASLYYTVWEGQVFSLYRREKSGLDTSVASFQSWPVLQKSTVIDSNKGLVISIINSIINGPQLIAAAASEDSAIQITDLSLLPESSLSNLEIDEASGTILAVCTNSTQAMIVSIPVVVTEASSHQVAGARLKILGELQCDASVVTPCPVLFSTSAYDRLNRVYFYVDPNSKMIMAFSVERSEFWGIYNFVTEVFGIICDEQRSLLLVFLGIWPSYPDSKLHLLTIDYKKDSFSLPQIVSSFVTAVDAFDVKPGPVTCDFVKEYCLLAGARGSLVEYNMNTNQSTKYDVTQGDRIVDFQFYIPRTPTLRIVSPSQLQSRGAKLTIYGTNFGLTVQGLAIKLGNIKCNQLVYIADYLVFCLFAQLRGSFDSISLGMTIMNENYIQFFENVVTIQGDSWSQLLPVSKFVTLAFAQNITFTGDQFSSSYMYRCLFAAAEYFAVCASPIAGNKSALVFELPLWLSFGQDTTVLLLNGQEYLGSFQPSFIVQKETADISATFVQSWAAVSPKCLDLTDHKTLITFYGLGFDPLSLDSYVCRFLTNHNLSVVRISFRQIDCAISVLRVDSMVAAIDTGFPSQSLGVHFQNVAYYNVSCSKNSLLEACTCDCEIDKMCCPQVQFNGNWNSMKPTVGTIGAGTIVTILGMGFNIQIKYQCSFQTGSNVWLVPGVVNNPTSLLCNTSYLKSGQNIIQLAVGISNYSLAGTDCFCRDLGCLITGIPLSFQFKSYFKALSISHASAAGNILLSVLGAGFDSNARYTCTFSNITVFAQNTSYSEILFLVPIWPYASTTVNLLLKSSVSHTIEAEFPFQYTQVVVRIVPSQTVAYRSTKFEVWGYGFFLNPSIYFCELLSDQGNQTLATNQTGIAVSVNYSLIVCEHLVAYSSVNQFRIYYQQPGLRRYLLQAVFYDADPAWSAVVPTTISPEGGMLTIVGVFFEGKASLYRLNICFSNLQVCPWQNMTAENASEKYIIFMIPLRNVPSGEGSIDLTYNASAIAPALGTSFFVSTLIKSVVPVSGCLFLKNPVAFLGFGFMFELENIDYNVLFKDDHSLSQIGSSCTVLNNTVLTCLTPSWPYAAVVNVTITASCHGSNLNNASDSLCTYNRFVSVSRLTYSFAECVTKIQPTMVGAAKSNLLWISVIGFSNILKGSNITCHFTNLALDKPSLHNNFADTEAYVQNSSIVSCLSPAGIFPSGAVQFQLFLDNSAVIFPNAQIIFVIVEITGIFPAEGSGAGRIVTVIGAGFHSEHYYICSILGGSNSTPVLAVDLNSLVCKLPVWRDGLSNVSVLVFDITENYQAWGHVNFFYAEGLISLSNSVGPASGGNKIYMVGEAFSSSVNYTAIVGSVSIVNVNFVNSTFLWFISPAWHYPSAVVDVKLSDDKLRLDAGTVPYQYVEVITSMVPSGGFVFGSYLLVRGFGFRQHGNYTCKLASRTTSLHWIETAITAPRRLSSSEIEFSIPRWNYSHENLDVYVYSEFGLLTPMNDASWSYEMKSAWISAAFDPKTSHVGGTAVKIFGGGFDPDSSYTCQFRMCEANGVCDLEDSSSSTIHCTEDACNRGPYKAIDKNYVRCYVPAWLHFSDSAFLRVFEDDTLLEQIFGPASKIFFGLAPLVNLNYNSVNAPSSGGSLINIDGSNYGMVDLSPRIRIGLSSCTRSSWQSNTQVQCMVPSTSAIETGIPLVASISPYQIGTACKGFTYDGPILEGGLLLPNVSNSSKPNLKTICNAPAISEKSWSVLTGSFAYNDLTLRSRMGSSAARATVWMSNTVVACQIHAGIGTENSIVLSLDQAAITKANIFAYDLPTISASFESNIWLQTQGLLNFSSVQSDGLGFGGTKYSCVFNAGYTSAEFTQWISDSSVSVRMPSGAFSTLWIGITAGKSSDSVSGSLTYNNPNVPNFMLRQESNILTSGNRFLWSFGDNVPYASLRSFLGNSGGQVSMWLSDSSVLVKQAQGSMSSHCIALTTGVKTGTASDVASYDTPSLSFAWFNISEGLWMIGHDFSGQGVGLHISSEICKNSTKLAGCEWTVINNAGSLWKNSDWSFCYNTSTCACNQSKINAIQPESKCKQLAGLLASNAVIEYTSLSSATNDIDAESFLIYTSDGVYALFYPGWLDSIVEFQFVVFPEDSSANQWLGLVFGYYDANQYSRFEMNNQLGIYRIRKIKDDTFDVWDCAPNSRLTTFTFGSYYTVRIAVSGNSVSVYMNEVSTQVLDNLVDDLFLDLTQEPSTWLQLCQVDFDVSIGASSNSFGFFGSGPGTAYFLNLHFYNPYLVAKRSNAVTSLSKSLTIQGIGFVLTSATAKPDIKHTSCEASWWSSDSTIICLSPKHFGGTLSSRVTAGLNFGTLSEVLSYSTAVLSGAAISNRLSNSVTTLKAGPLGFDPISAAVSMGGSFCEASNWLSITSVSSKCAVGLGWTFNVALTVGILAGTASDIVSYNIGSFIRNSKSNYPATGAVSISIRGISFGQFAPTIAGAVSGTSLGKTVWVSDTAARCSPAILFWSTSSTVFTFGMKVGTLTSAFSTDTGVLGINNKNNLPPSSVNGFVLLATGFGSAVSSSSLSIGGSVCKPTLWISNSALRVNIAAGDSMSLRLLITTSEAKLGTHSVMISFDLPVLKDGNETLPLTQTRMQNRSLAMTGVGIGNFDFSVSSGVGLTAAEKTIWKSDTSAIANMPYGLGNGLLLTLTIHSAVGTLSNSVSYVNPLIISNLSSTTFSSISGSWCSVESAVCVCSGIVQFKSFQTLSATYAESTSSIMCSSPSPFADPSPGNSIKTCFCFEWPFPGGQVLSILGKGFGFDDFSPKLRVSTTSSSSTQWISDSSLLAILPPCTNCGSVSMSQNIVVTVARTMAYGTFPLIFNFNIGTASACPYYSFSTGTYILSSSTGYLCRTSYGNNESLSWIIDVCTANNNCNYYRSGNSVSLVTASIQFLSFNTLPNHGILSVFACTTVECTSSTEKLKLHSGSLVPAAMLGNPYLKVQWYADTNAIGSTWLATWTTSFDPSFSIFFSDANFASAAAACKALSSGDTVWNLASITSKQENDAVGSLSSSDYAWIGLHYNSTGALVWFDGTPFGSESYTNWVDGYPSPDYMNTCVVIALGSNSNGWESKPCSSYFPYVCSNKLPLS